MKNLAHTSISLFCVFALLGSLVGSYFANSFGLDVTCIILFFLSRSPNKRYQFWTIIILIGYILGGIIIAYFALFDPTSINFGPRKLTPEEGSWTAVFMGVLALWSIINVTLLLKKIESKEV